MCNLKCIECGIDIYASDIADNVPGLPHPQLPLYCDSCFDIVHGVDSEAGSCYQCGSICHGLMCHECASYVEEDGYYE